MYSYISPEARVRADHALRTVRVVAYEALKQRNMSGRFDEMYAKAERPSIPPVKLLRAQLIQMLYWVRSETDGGNRLRHAVPLACGNESGWSRVGRDGVYEEP